jgi:hypothetical protein
MEFNTSLASEIKALILQSREQAIRAVDHTRVLLYWNIGKRIFEEEQAGKERADYGTFWSDLCPKRCNQNSEANILFVS